MSEHEHIEREIERLITSQQETTKASEEVAGKLGGLAVSVDNLLKSQEGDRADFANVFGRVGVLEVQSGSLVVYAKVGAFLAGTAWIAIAGAVINEAMK